jgi:hypothetical protein
MPTEEELTERFENEQCVCDTCNEELLADLDFVEETSYYELLVTQ